MLDEDGLPDHKVEAVREGLKALDKERQSGDPLAATAREVLGLLEAAGLPLPVLAGASTRSAWRRPTEGRAPRCCSRAAVGGRAPGGRGRVHGLTSRRRWRSWKRPTPAGRQGADPPVPGHAPVDVDDVDREDVEVGVAVDADRDLLVAEIHHPREIEGGADGGEAQPIDADDPPVESQADGAIVAIVVEEARLQPAVRWPSRPPVRDPQREVGVLRPREGHASRRGERDGRRRPLQVEPEIPVPDVEPAGDVSDLLVADAQVADGGPDRVAGVVD